MVAGARNEHKTGAGNRARTRKRHEAGLKLGIEPELDIRLALRVRQVCLMGIDVCYYRC